MSSFSLAPVSSLDRFDDGFGRLDLPINYDDYFRLLANPDIFINASVATDENGQRRIQLDAVVIKLILEWGYALARKISSASFGGTLPRGQADPLALRAGSLEALGVPLPPLFQLFRRFQDDGFPLAQPLSDVDFVCWMQVVRENAISTRDWLANAQCRLAIFGSSTGWDFDSATFRQDNALSLYAPVVTSSAPLCPPAERRNLIPHPVIGPGAKNEVIPYPSTPLLSTRPLPVPENSCRDVIPHPIYGPGAQNALVLFGDGPHTARSNSATRELIGQSIERPRAPTPWSTCGSNLEYPDSPALSYANFPTSPFVLTDISETSSSGTTDSSETPSDYYEPMGHFTVYEESSSGARSVTDTEVSLEKVTIGGDADDDYARYQAAVEDALGQEEGTRRYPIDLTN